MHRILQTKFQIIILVSFDYAYINYAYDYAYWIFKSSFLVTFNYIYDYAYKIVKSSLWKHQESTFNYAYDYAYWIFKSFC